MKCERGGAGEAPSSAGPELNLVGVEHVCVLHKTTPRTAEDRVSQPCPPNPRAAPVRKHVGGPRAAALRREGLPEQLHVVPRVAQRVQQVGGGVGGGREAWRMEGRVGGNRGVHTKHEDEGCRVGRGAGGEGWGGTAGVDTCPGRRPRGQAAAYCPAPVCPHTCMTPTPACPYPYQPTATSSRWHPPIRQHVPRPLDFPSLPTHPPPPFHTPCRSPSAQLPTTRHMPSGLTRPLICLTMSE